MACDIDTGRETLDRLTSTRGAEARRLVGFDRPRQSKGAGDAAPLGPIGSDVLSRYKLSWAHEAAGKVTRATRGSIAAGSAARRLRRQGGRRGAPARRHPGTARRVRALSLPASTREAEAKSRLEWGPPS
jgi:hypothetical protein